MRLNVDCVRDVLLAAESIFDNMESWGVSENLPAQLSPYTYNESVYHIRQCIKAGLLEPGQEFIDGTFMVLDLTPAGHRVLSMIRNPDVYQKAHSSWTEKVRDGLISASISGFFSVASEVLKTALS